MSKNKETSQVEQNKHTSKKRFSMKGISFKKMALFFVIILIGIGMLPFATDRLSMDSDKWIQVGDKSINSNVILGEYSSYVEKNYFYIQQNPFMLANFLNNLISQYITMLLFANEAESIYLGADEEQILTMITGIPYFKNEDGTFNKEEFLKRVNVVFGSEKAFLDNAKNNVLKDQLIEGITPLINQPQYLGYLDYLALTQERTVSYIELFPTLVQKKIPLATEEDLKKLRDENKDIFTTAETRSGSFVYIDLVNTLSKIKPSQEELLDYYDTNKNNFLQEESREVSQITFENKRDAEDAYKKLKNSSITEAEKDYAVVSIGNVTYEGFPEELSKSIFATPEGTFSTPVESSIGWHIFITQKVNPVKPASFTEVKDVIEQEVLIQKRNDYKINVMNEFNNLSSEGLSLQDIAKTLKITYSVWNNVNSTDMSKSNEALQTFFSVSAKAQPILLEDTSNGNLYAVFVDNINASKLESIDEAKVKLTKIWNEKHTEEQLSLLSGNLVEKFIVGKDINKLGYRVKTNKMALTSSDTPFEVVTISNLFMLEKNLPLEGTLNNGNKFIAIVSNIKNSGISFTNKDGIRNQEIVNFTNYINQGYTQAFFSQYALNLDKKFKVKINEKAIIETLAPEK